MSTHLPLLFSSSIREDFWSYCRVNAIEQPIILCDTNTLKHCLPLLGNQDLFRLICIPDGELNKSWEQLNELLQQLLVLNVNRNETLFILGGGVLTDIGGLSAALYQRGIPHVNIPTTLMGMVDAAIGGKTAIDFAGIKNFIGIVKQPETCIIAPVFLKTLPEIEYQSAWSEIVKVAIIDSLELWELIHMDASIETLIPFCAQHKYDLVQQDEHDKSVRQLLNFGHTIGHALESYYLSINQPILHGFAVAKGMLFEIDLAQKLNMISIEESKSMKLMIQTKVRVESINHNEFEGLKSFLIKDKKNINSNIVFSLPTGIGKGKWGIELEWDTLLKVYSIYY
jgi:3-dehydroquinate synthase